MKFKNSNLENQENLGKRYRELEKLQKAITRSLSKIQDEDIIRKKLAKITLIARERYRIYKMLNSGDGGLG